MRTLQHRLERRHIQVRIFAPPGLCACELTVLAHLGLKEVGEHVGCFSPVGKDVEAGLDNVDLRLGRNAGPDVACPHCE